MWIILTVVLLVLIIIIVGKWHDVKKAQLICFWKASVSGGPQLLGYNNIYSHKKTSFLP